MRSKDPRARDEVRKGSPLPKGGNVQGDRKERRSKTVGMPAG
jgi:hypothetical protein